MQTTGELFDVRGRRVTVMGLGHFGGGVAAVRFLAERGARVTVTDLLDEAALADSLAELNGIDLQALHLGGHREQDFLEADLVVVNPAVKPTNRFVELAGKAGVPLTSEMNLFWMHNHGRVIGVTGSNGKSTTAALVYAMLEAAGLPCWFGGNIGHSLLDDVDRIGPQDWVVLELSSFQLRQLDRLFTSPEIAVVTNFSPNHLDWHGSLEDYRSSKQTILRWQLPQHAAALNADDPDVTDWPVSGRRLLFGLRDRGQCGAFDAGSRMILRANSVEEFAQWPGLLRLPGSHNRQNVLAAACAAFAADVTPTAICAAVENFRPLPHRLEFVGEIAGRLFYNDSLATTPESAQAALEAFGQPVVLLAGGYDKHVDLSVWAAAIAARVKAVALMGETADELAYLIEQESVGRPVPLRECASLKDAFHWAVQRSDPGDVVLLSPGCASYDWFRNFAERGRRFTQCVADWANEHAAATSSGSLASRPAW